MCFDCQESHDAQVGKAARWMGIRWTPLDTCMEHRLQTLAAFTMYFTAPTLMIFIPCMFLYVLFFTSYYYIALLYLVWMIWDRKTPDQGGRSIDCIRKATFYKYFANYFPVRLHKTADLDKTKNYLFGLHPHGIFASAHVASFASDAAKFSELFPGISPKMLTLKHFYYLPVSRDVMMLGGSCPASKECISSILSHSKGGMAACLPIGGAAEAMNTDPSNIRLVAKNRKGFVKMAMAHGAPLVPVFAFGETDLFQQVNSLPGSWFRVFQDAVRKITGVPPYFFRGRGIFQYDFGIVAYKRPLNVIVGSPIEVPLITDPTKEEVDEFHQKYLDSLQELFDKHKKNYSPNSKVTFI